MSVSEANYVKFSNTAVDNFVKKIMSVASKTDAKECSVSKELNSHGHLGMTQLLTSAIEVAETCVTCKGSGATKYELVIRFVAEFGASLMGVNQSTIDKYLDVFAPMIVKCLIHFANNTTEIQTKVVSCMSKIKCC